MNIDRDVFSQLYDDNDFYDERNSDEFSSVVSFDLVPAYDSNSKKIIFNGVEFEVSGDGKTLLSCSKSIEKFIIPDTIEAIADQAFSDCKFLEDIVIPKHVKQIGTDAFAGCEKLKSVEILGPVEVLHSTFARCEELVHVKLPDTLKKMEHVFYWCSGLRQVELPDSLEVLGSHCFYNSGITNIKIPKNVYEIGSAAFWNCRHLLSCEFDSESKLELIGGSAFAECEYLSGPELSKGTKLMQQGYDIDELKNNPGFVNFGHGNLIVSASEVNDFDKFTYDKINYPFKLPDTVKVIGDSAFKNTGLVEFEIPSGVAELSNNVFEHCGNLKKVVMHDNILKIGEECFWGCRILEQINLSRNIYEIGPRSFSGCVFLKSIDLPQILVKIPDELFSGCSRLYSLGMPLNIESIGSKSFYRCGNLKNIFISPKISFIAEDAFLDCFLNSVDYGEITFKKKQSCEVNEFLSCNSKDGFIRKIKSVSSNQTGFKIMLDLDDYSHDCSKVLSAILHFADENDLYKNILCKFNKEQFMKNIKFFKDNNLDYLDFCNSVISYGNYSLLYCDIEKAFNNYNYLLEQNILNKDLLNNIYFEGAVGTNAKELFLDYFRSNNRLPDLFKTLLVEDNDRNQLELRDRLVYVSTMQLLDGNYNDEKYDKAMVMLKRTLFENIVSNDKKHMSIINEDVYSEIEKYYPEMIGMMSTFYNKINGIDSTWFTQLFNEIKIKGQETRFRKFYNSLTTIKNWNQYTNDVERATLLKNEIIGRLIYADIMLTVGGDTPKKDSYINKKMNLDANSRLDVAELLDYASKDRLELFKNSEAITTMLMIDPYSFDALRRGPLDSMVLKKKDLDVKSARLAIAHGYIFEEDEIAQYKRVRNDNEFNLEPSLDSYVESILDSIGCAKIPEEDKETYLNNMRKQIKIYINEKSEEELFKFCRSFDLYLRNNGEYIVQGKDSSNIAKKMFDANGEHTNDVRVMYCLYNLNRIAHNSLELNCKSAIKNRFRLATNNDISYERMEDIFDAYNRLYRCGIDSDLVSILLDKGSSRGITDLIFSDESSMDQAEIFNKDKEIVSILNRLNISDVRTNPIMVDEATKIKSDLNVIYSMSDIERDIIGTSVLEQNTFFECKRMFSEEMINRLASEFSNDMIRAMGTSIDEKRKYYAEHGYIVEVQGDLGEEVLVCLCEAFNEPFSVHLKDLPENIVNALRLVPRTNTIAHCSLDGKGLSFRYENYEQDMLSISSDFNFTGFNGGRSNLKYVQKSNYDQYDIYAKQIRSSAGLDAMFDNALSDVNSVDEKQQK